MLREKLKVVELLMYSVGGGMRLRVEEDDEVKEKNQHDDIDHERVESDVGVGHAHHENLQFIRQMARPARKATHSLDQKLFVSDHDLFVADQDLFDQETRIFSVEKKRIGIGKESTGWKGIQETRIIVSY